MFNIDASNATETVKTVSDGASGTLLDNILKLVDLVIEIGKMFF